LSLFGDGKKEAKLLSFEETFFSLSFHRPIPLSTDAITIVRKMKQKRLSAVQASSGHFGRGLLRNARKVLVAQQSLREVKWYNRG
jgi:hypothetical protein